MKNGKAILQPYPSWEMQTIGDMSALQYVQSFEIDSRLKIKIKNILKK